MMFKAYYWSKLHASPETKWTKEYITEDPFHANSFEEANDKVKEEYGEYHKELGYRIWVETVSVQNIY